MISLLLLLIAIASFVFYGVVGQDKTWLLAPAFVFSYTAITIALLKRASRMANGEAGRREPATSNQQPVTALLWIAFLFYGIAFIPQAVVPFESKLVMLFIGGVVGAYLVWGSELTTFKDNRILLGMLIFVVMLAAFYGLIVHFKCPERVLWMERYAIYEGRLMSTYICPNHFAHLMQMLIPFCVALLFIPQAGLYLRMLSAYSFLAFLPPMFLTESRAGWLGSIAATGVVLCLMALRRSKRLFLVLVIVIPVCSVLLLFAGWKYSETFQRRARPVVEFLQHQNEEGVGSEAKDFRPQTWMDTIDMIEEKPLIGFGPGNYRYTFPEHRKRFRGARIVTGHPHNEYLELIADFGLIGFGLFALAWCYGLIRILIASLRAEETRHAFIGFAFLGAAAGTMVHSFFDFEMNIYPNALVFALLAALAWAPLAAQRAKSSRGTRHKALGIRGENELSAAGSELFAKNPATNNYQPTTKLRRAGAWLLAVGYLLMAVLCLQIMSSAFIRALGDRASKSLDSSLTAERFYSLSARIDPQNWRAYKGMGNLLFDNRYYSLEMEEKIRLAGQERSWYEKAYEQNPKDPEICLAYGKALIFLGKNQGTRNSALGIRVDEGTTGMSSEVDSRQSALASGEVDDLINEHSTTINPFQTRGLDLLREACKYRPFNDGCWWNLGVELRNAGRYEESLDVFRRAVSIKRTPSMLKNIEWLKNRLKALDEGGGAVDDLPLRVGSSKINTSKSKLEEPAEPVLDVDASGIAADPGLMDLLDRMGE